MNVCAIVESHSYLGCFSLGIICLRNFSQMYTNLMWCKSLLETNRHSRMYYRILWKENSLLFINAFLKVWRMYRTHSAHTYSSILPHPPPSSSTSPPSSHQVPISLFLFVLALGPIEFTQGHLYEPGWWGLQWRTNVSPTATPLKTVIPLAPAALDYNSILRTGQAFPPPPITGGLRAQSCIVPV